jgi:hypothetical protein
LIKVAYLKCRSSKKHEPFFVQYSDAEKGLVIADHSTIQETMDSRNQKASLDSTLEFIGAFLTEPMPRKDFIEKLCAEMNCKERTVEARLKSIITHSFAIPVGDGKAKTLCKKTENREIIYYLTD